MYFIPISLKFFLLLLEHFNPRRKWRKLDHGPKNKHECKWNIDWSKTSVISYSY